MWDSSPTAPFTHKPNGSPNRMDLELIPCKDMIPGPNTTLKLTHKGRIVQAHISKPPVHSQPMWDLIHSNIIKSDKGDGCIHEG